MANQCAAPSSSSLHLSPIFYTGSLHLLNLLHQLNLLHPAPVPSTSEQQEVESSDTQEEEDGEVEGLPGAAYRGFGRCFKCSKLHPLAGKHRGPRGS